MPEVLKVFGFMFLFVICFVFVISRCYNCGDFGNHIAAKCPYGPLPKRCHNCKSTEHLIADCPLRDPQDKKPGDGRFGNGMGGGEFQGQGQGAMGHV